MLSQDCIFASWDVRLDPGAFRCSRTERQSTGCLFTSLAENTTYTASVQELCLDATLSSLVATARGRTLSVSPPMVALHLPLVAETVEERPQEITVVYDVDVELGLGLAALGG